MHQEDYCQALGKPPFAKYELNQTGVSGPKLDEMFELTRQYLPPTEVVRLLDMVIFNVVACNTDAHSKNYSIMIRGNGVSLAPIYDVMCGEVWENVTKKLAQAIAGKRQGDCLNARDWQRFARESGLNPNKSSIGYARWHSWHLRKHGSAECEVAEIAGGRTTKYSGPTREAVERRAHSLLAQLDEPGEEPASEPSAPALLAGIT